MKNRLFELSEDEKSRILNLHESAKSDPSTRKSIDEQYKLTGGKFDVGLNRKTVSKTIRPADFQLDDKFVKDPQFAKEYLKGKSFTGAGDIGGKATIDEKWLPKMDDESKTNFNNMIVKEPVFTASLVYSFDPSEYKKIFVSEKEIQTVEPGTENPPKVKPIEIKFPLYVPPTTKFFEDNRSTPTAALIGEFESISKIIGEQIREIQSYGDENAEQVKPLIIIDNINFKSSANKFKNKPYEITLPDGTKKMVNPGDFCKLSGDRANKALEKMKSILKNNVQAYGGDVTFEFAKENIDTKGENGDCTSGPDPYVEGMKLVKSNPKKYPDLGAVFRDKDFRDEYEKYKYVEISITYYVDPVTLLQLVPQPDTEGDVIVSSLYRLTFTKKVWDFDFNIELPKIVKYPRARKPLFGGIFQKEEMGCPVSVWEKIKYRLKGKKLPNIPTGF